MKQHSIGTVVRCTAGREKDQILAIVGEDADYVYLADGTHRRMEAPKRKSRKHITAIGSAHIAILQSNDIGQVNAHLRKELKQIGKMEEEYV